MIGPARSVRGGVSAVVNALLEAMPEDAPDIRYVPTHVDGSKFVKLLVALVGIVRVFFAITVWRCDLLHIHTASDASFARKSRIAAMGQLWRRKVILHVHGAEFDRFFDEAGTSLKRVITWRLMWADLVIALSEGWRERLRQMSPEARIRVLPNPIDTRTFAGLVESRPPVHDAGGTVLFLGAFTKRKGTYDLVEIAAEVVARRPSVCFELGGDRDVREVERLVRQRGISGNVRIMGWVRGREKIEAFERAHVFILPSYHEGLPMAVLEALAAGLPLVTTPVGGIPEVVRDGVNGIIVEPGDVGAAASAIVRLLEDNDLRDRMSRANVELARSRHDARIVARTLVGWYDELLRNVHDGGAARRSTGGGG